MKYSVFPFFFLLLVPKMLFAQSLEKYLSRSKYSLRLDSLVFLHQEKTLTVDSVVAFRDIKKMESTLKAADADELDDLGKVFKAWYYCTGKQSNNSLCLSYLEANHRKFKTINSASILAQNLKVIRLQTYAQYYTKHSEGKEKEALRLFLESEAILQKIGYEHAYFTAQALTNIGEFYFNMNEYKTALVYLQKAEKCLNKEPWDWAKINTYNTLGLTYARLREREKAIDAYRQVIKQVHQAKDSVWVGIASGNMGEQYYFLKKYNEALQALEVDYAYSMHYKEYCSAYEALSSLCQIASIGKKVTEATDYLQKMRILLKDCPGPNSQKSLYESESGVAIARHDYRAGYELYRKSIKLKDSLRKAKTNNEIQANTVKFQAEQERILLEAQQAYTALQRNLAALIALITGIAAYFIWRAVRLRAQKQQILSELEQQKLEQKLLQQQMEQDLQQQKMEQELQHAQLELQQFMDSIRQKNTLIQQFQEEIENMQSLLQDTSLQEDKIKVLERLANSTIVTKQSWVQFTQLMEQVYPNFITQLKIVYPTLSPAEIRLLVLTKLEFSTKEMAGMLGVSLDAIHKGRYRLRKKLELPEEDNFEGMLRQFS